MGVYQTHQASTLRTEVQTLQQRAEANRLTIEVNKSQLEEKLKILAGVLTPAQLNSYREEKMNEINMAEKMTEMFLPKKPAGTAN